MHRAPLVVVFLSRYSLGRTAKSCVAMGVDLSVYLSGFELVYRGDGAVGPSTSRMSTSGIARKTAGAQNL